MKTAEVKGALQISGAAFRSELEGQLRVRSSVAAEGASFAVAAFDSLRVERDFSAASLNGVPATFNGPARFTGAQ
jgi:hypothetical protein